MSQALVMNMAQSQSTVYLLQGGPVLAELNMGLRLGQPLRLLKRLPG